MLFSGVYKLWEDPLIVSCMVGSEQHALAIDKSADIILHESWLSTWRSLAGLMRYRWTASRAGKRVHFMGCAVESERLRRRSLMPGALINISIYIDHKLYDIRPTPKKFDAIYPARMEYYKRLHLASDVKSLYVHTYGALLKEDGSFDLHRYEPKISHAAFNTFRVSVDELVTSYNAARVVLALSEVEGAMLGSVEGMLCGLPQVSTYCKGGREQFFDDRYVRVVAPEPGRIAAAVDELVRLEIDPQFVRAETLKKLRVHRDRLIDYIIKIIRSRKGRVPSQEAVEERLFGGPEALLSTYVHRRNFESAGLA
ncbi:MAG TPA: glycosyltransferase [Vicinamibacterales bacterium]|nr:glycosyltransferase [Vicinamibacterales bacterium]